MEAYGDGRLGSELGDAALLESDTRAVACFLLTWNPSRWSWRDLDEHLVQASLGRPVRMRWSSGKTLRIAPGDRVFLLKQGTPPRGIMASGTVARGVFQANHWDKSREGEKALYVMVLFERLVSPDGVLPLDELEGRVPEIYWHPVAGGVAVPAELVGRLDDLWNAHVPSRAPLSILEELSPGARYYEGAVQRVLVNRYERDPKARADCLKVHGYRCAVCDFSFEDAYGVLGREFIHVHHLEPLSTRAAECEVEPVRDLRPVCANCHAMLHRREPPLTIEQLRAMLAQRA